MLSSVHCPPSNKQKKTHSKFLFSHRKIRQNYSCLCPFFKFWFVVRIFLCSLAMVKTDQMQISIEIRFRGFMDLNLTMLCVFSMHMRSLHVFFFISPYPKFGIELRYSRTFNENEILEPDYVHLHLF